MRRKQITYAHRRNRNRISIPQESKSSPLEDTHPEMAGRILKRSRRSDSVSTSLNLLSEDHTRCHSSKKLKASLPEDNEQERSLIVALNDNYDLHTPHPTQLTEDQVFKLKSSRGLPLSPDHDFSPVPLAPPQRSFSPNLSSKPTRITHNITKRGSDNLMHRTSSRSLKENTSVRHSRSASKAAAKSATSTTGKSSRRITRSRSKAQGSRLHLASPFTSQPSSPHTHPVQNLHGQSITKPTMVNKINKITTATIANSKRILELSDTHYNSNLPQAQSTANSPTRPSGIKARRPSAPSTTSYRPDVASWFVSPLNQGGIMKTGSSFDVVHSPTIFDLGSGTCGRGLSVDFNRPPSQMSFSSAYDEDLFGDAQGVSTPFGLKLAKRVQRYEYVDPMESSSEDEDEGQHLNNHVSYTSLPYSEPGTNQIKLDKTTSVFKVPEREYSTWVTDSLISVPTALRAYSLSRSLDHLVPDVRMLDNGGEDETTLGLGPGFGMDLGPCFKDVLIRYDGANRTEYTEDREETLKELFEGLEIAYGGTSSRPALTRSRSLDLDSPSPPQPPNITSKEGGIQVQPLESPVYISPSKAKHTVANLNSGTNRSTNKRETRDRRGTIRASDFPPNSSEGVGLAGGARRTRSGTVVGPALNRRERSGTVVAAARPLCLAGALHVVGHGNGGRRDTGEVDVDIPLQQPAHDADVEMSDDSGTNLKIGVREDDSGIDADPMNIVGPWRDVDWPWVVADPPSPVRPHFMKAENRKLRSRLGLGLKMPKGELWQMREHDGEDGEDDPMDILR